MTLTDVADSATTIAATQVTVLFIFCFNNCYVNNNFYTPLELMRIDRSLVY